MSHKEEYKFSVQKKYLFNLCIICIMTSVRIHVKRDETNYAEWTKNNDYVSIYNRGFQKAQIKQWKRENVTHNSESTVLIF